MPAPRRDRPGKRPKLPRELFETRTHAWQSLGLGEEIETRGVSKGSLVGLVVAILAGLAAQQALGAIFAGIVLQSTRPFRVGERVRFVGGALAGSLEGTVTALGLFYTTLSQGADRLQIPNNVLLNVAVVPLREPEKVDVKVRFPRYASPREIEHQLLRTITVPTRYRPTAALEDVEPDGVFFRIPA